MKASYRSYSYVLPTMQLFCIWPAPQALRELAETTERSLLTIFDWSQQLGEGPKDWWKRNITPAFKNGKKTYPVTYTLVSLTLYLGKVTEQLTVETISRHMSEKRISSRQCEFTESHDWLNCHDEMTGLGVRGEQWTLSIWTLLRPLILSPVRAS